MWNISYVGLCLIFLRFITIFCLFLSEMLQTYFAAHSVAVHSSFVINASEVYIAIQICINVWRLQFCMASPMDCYHSIRNFYSAMLRGYATVCRLSVRLSVRDVQVP